MKNTKPVSSFEKILKAKMALQAAQEEMASAKENALDEVHSRLRADKQEYTISDIAAMTGLSRRWLSDQFYNSRDFCIRPGTIMRRYMEIDENDEPTGNIVERSYRANLITAR